MQIMRRTLWYHFGQSSQHKNIRLENNLLCSGTNLCGSSANLRSHMCGANCWAINDCDLEHTIRDPTREFSNQFFVTIEIFQVEYKFPVHQIENSYFIRVYVTILHHPEVCCRCILLSFMANNIFWLATSVALAAPQMTRGAKSRESDK